MMWFRKTRIYADAAAATPISAHARSELLRLLDVYGNAGALHSEAVAAKNEMDAARNTIAASIGAHADELIFCASGTEGNNIAIEGVLRPLLHKYGPLHAITLAIEHQSVLEPLRALRADGLELTEMPVDSEGFVSIKDVREAITDKTVFISVQLVNSEVGTIEPIQEIAKEVRHVRKLRQSSGDLVRSGPLGQVLHSPTAALPLLYHSDASQAPLWLDMKVERLGIDLLTLDAQKVQGPKGVGALYIKRRIDIAPVIRGGVQERGLRGGTPNTPLMGSFAAAMQDASTGVEERAARVAEVRNFLWSEIKKRIPEVILNGPSLPAQKRVANNLNISIPGLDGEAAVLGLDAMGIAISTRSACNVGDEEPSHVIKALGVPKALSKTAMRITLLPSTTKRDAVRIADALAEIAKRYKNVV